MPDIESREPAPSATRLLRRRHVVIGGLLAVASAVAFARQPDVFYPVVPSDEFEEWVPSAFGAWKVQSTSGVVLPPPDALSDRLYDNLVTRVYEAPGMPSVMLLLAYNNRQDGMLQVHRPEVCYPVGGYQLTETQKIQISAGGVQIPANFFSASSPDRTEQVAYFTRLDDSFPRSWGEQRLAVAEANITGRIPDGAMMRVSVLGDNPQEARQVLNEFSAAFIEASPSPLRKLLLG